jgi:hypothetical protein
MGSCVLNLDEASKIIMFCLQNLKYNTTNEKATFLYGGYLKIHLRVYFLGIVMFFHFFFKIMF